MDMLRIWGGNLLARRRELGLTQEQVAARVGVRQTTYQRWEAGAHRSPDAVRPRLAKALGCSVYELFPYPDGDDDASAEEIGA